MGLLIAVTPCSPLICLAAQSLAVWSWTLCAVVATIVLIQTFIVRRYVELLDEAAPGGLGDDGPLPRAAIVLSLLSTRTSASPGRVETRRRRTQAGACASMRSPTPSASSIIAWPQQVPPFQVRMSSREPVPAG